MNRLLANFAILCVTVFIGTLLFEIFVRQFLPQYDPSGHLSFTTNDRGVPIALNRGLSRQIKNTGDYDVSIQISNLGLREPKELSTSTKSDVIVVGDSFSFGWGVEENERYSNRLDAILTTKKVFNISIPTDFDGYGKLLDYAKENGATINKLIIGVTMENDLRHYSIKRNGLDKNHGTAKGNNALRHLKLYLRENSAAYFLTTSLVHSNLAMKKFAIFLGLIKPSLQGIPALKFSQQLIIDSSDRLNKLIKPFDPIILIIPSRALWTGTEEYRNTADKIHKAFIKELDRRKIKYVDPRSLIEKNNMPLHYHFKYDGHWTRDAHQIAAKALARAINANW